MNKNFNKIVLFLVAMLTSIIAKAQQPEIEMATGMRQSGKIYVVVGVLVIIFSGITAFLIHLDRKLSKLEKENK